MAIRIPDVSEFQGQIDWPNLDADIAIVRLCYGDVSVDKKADVNIEGARTRCVARGWYCYLVAGRDPVAQANVFIKILQAHGGLKPNEFIVVDDEESNGANEVERTNAFLDRCDAALNSKSDWWYSGLNFAVAHNLSTAKGHRWVAAYGVPEPKLQHDLWQFSSKEQIRGISGNVDMSVFNGTVDDFVKLIGGTLTSTRTELYGGAMGNNILLPDPDPDLEVAIWRVVLQDGTGHVFWGLDAGGEGAEDKGIWLNDLSANNAPASGPVCIEAGTLGVILHRYQGDKRITFSGRELNGTDHWQTTYQAHSPWKVIEPWHKVPMNVIIASGAKGEAGPSGPAYDDTALKARLAAVEEFENKLKVALS